MKETTRFYIDNNYKIYEVNILHEFPNPWYKMAYSSVHDYMYVIAYDFQVEVVSASQLYPTFEEAKLTAKSLIRADMETQLEYVESQKL